MPFVCMICGYYIDSDSGAPYECPDCGDLSSFIRCKSKVEVNENE